MPDVPNMIPPTPPTPEEQRQGARRCIERFAPADQQRDILAALGLVNEPNETSGESR